MSAPRSHGSPAIARWIRRELADDPPRAPSLVVSIWGDALAAKGDEFWLSTLFTLVAPFGINVRAVRTGVFRLHRGGWLASRAVGRRSRYRLTAAGAEGFERAFHRVYDPPFPRWDGEWEGVIVAADAGGPALRKRVRDELAWAGYGRYGAGIFVRPARRDGAAGRIADALRVSSALTVFSARDTDDASISTLRDRVATVWSIASLGGEYRRFLARFGGIAQALRNGDASAEQAFVVRTLLIHAYRRVRLRDPQLPRELVELVEPDWPGARAYEVARVLYRTLLPASEAFVRGVLDDAHERASVDRLAVSRFAPRR